MHCNHPTPSTGRPVRSEIYEHRNEVERTISRRKDCKVIATCYDKRTHVVHRTLAAAAIR
ncbi:hypothetical protein [Streptomyces sp. NPDC051546]|uniref:hypothetical protein n=1 Tax=Streptomyces sp. NPDC051546 TaxID=3365655 RepID=UPI0037997568